MALTSPMRAVADLRLAIAGTAAWLATIAALALPAAVGIAVGVAAVAGAAAATKANGMRSIANSSPTRVVG